MRWPYLLSFQSLKLPLGRPAPARRVQAGQSVSQPVSQSASSQLSLTAGADGRRTDLPWKAVQYGNSTRENALEKLRFCAENRNFERHFFPPNLLFPRFCSATVAGCIRTAVMSHVCSFISRRDLAIGQRERHQVKDTSLAARARRSVSSAGRVEQSMLRYRPNWILSSRAWPVQRAHLGLDSVGPAVRGSARGRGRGPGLAVPCALRPAPGSHT